MRFEIAGQPIGPGAPLFVIAELGLNHGGRLDRALELVDAAAAAGASAVKLQTFRADELVAATCPAPTHVPHASLQEFFKQFELDRAAHAAVAARARSRGLAFLATPFSIGAVDLLDDVGVDAFKIASGDLTYHALIERCARSGRPLVISTGMASLAETATAVSRARAAGARALALLHCVSSYPVPEDAQNLRAIQTLARMFGTPVGLSDHAEDTSAVPMAVALGASIYERHLMLAGDDGVDRAVSSCPDDLASAVIAARRAQAALGHGRRECLPAEAVNVTASRRALHAARPLSNAQTVTPADIAVLRPSRGLPPGFEPELVGSVLRRAVAAGTPFFTTDLSPRSRRDVA